MIKLLLNKNLLIERYTTKASHYLVETIDSNHQVVIDEATYQLIHIIQKSKTIFQRDLFLQYKEKYDPNITFEDVDEVVKFLVNTNIVLDSENHTITKRKNKYLKLRIPLIPSIVVNLLAVFFTFLYHKWVLRLVIGSIPFVIYGVIYNFKQLDLATIEGKSYFPLLLLSVLFHEIGHATALKSHGQKPKEIGFGLYLFILPVCYTNLSAAWKLLPKQRMRVNLGGLYFHYIFLIISFIASLFLDQEFTIFPIMLVILMLYQLNPFIRMDGYWVISDIIRIDNLMESSTKTLEEFGIQLFKKEPIKLNKTKKLLLAYALISKTYIIILYSSIILFTPNLFTNLKSNIIAILGTKIQLSFSYFMNISYKVALPIGIILGIGFWIFSNSFFIKKLYKLASKID